MSEHRVYMRDMRRVKHCSKGVRQWFKKHGFDYVHFLHHGIEAKALLDTNDAMAIKVVEASYGRK